MAKVIKFPIQTPEKFGFKPVRRRKAMGASKPGQLNLFAGGKQVKLNQLSTFEEALLLDEQGDAKARDLYQQAINEGDSVADAYCNLGILESGAKHFSRAIDCFTMSLKEEPRHFESHYNLANLYAEIGNYPLAKVHYQTSIEIEPGFPNSHFNLGLTLAMNKEIENAILSLMNYRKRAAPEDKGHADELISTLSKTFTG
ncbi:MAG: tetratricopeptide repeat protein [Cyclobacteriaceae bacterium]|nr:tetratricopeptide repeat protein [Cyclobacteriaceae bacterium]MCB0500544.1 tetratricopeptide repeat protein [Cyclobacteriaceae bacterium]MCB9239249.1 tetratricopeptide repeat protein [Flammeovirgaceae bacterium]MCO5272425.1 tetratricopeptide repeat protein [Cyclobacteriaceae bacterium]MCW5903318.1 tetratricopeptide repeat protein [Cyclobacteriaceae bacterium]